MPHEQTKITFSINDIMKRHGIGRNTIYHEIASGRLKTIRIGRRRLIPEKCESEWIANKLSQQGE